MNYPKLQCFLLLKLLILCFSLTFSAGEMLDNQESEEFENALVENVQKDYKSGFGELVNFMNSINSTITALKREIELQRTEIVDQKGKMTSQQEEIREFKQTVRHLHKIKSNSSWEDFDELNRSLETVVKIGNSFNGSTLSEIKSRASQVGELGCYTVVVFANHLIEAIQYFEIYDPYNYTNNPAPKSIPPHTQEIFTFAKPTDNVVITSFSYFIASARVRIAVISAGGVGSAGLAFISSDASMKTYWDNQKGIDGSWVYEDERGTDKNLSVSYKNLRAGLYAERDGYLKANLRIELIELPL